MAPGAVANLSRRSRSAFMASKSFWYLSRSLSLSAYWSSYPSNLFCRSTVSPYFPVILSLKSFTASTSASPSPLSTSFLIAATDASAMVSKNTRPGAGPSPIAAPTAFLTACVKIGSGMASVTSESILLTASIVTRFLVNMFWRCCNVVSPPASSSRPIASFKEFLTPSPSSSHVALPASPMLSTNLLTESSKPSLTPGIALMLVNLLIPDTTVSFSGANITLFNLSTVTSNAS